MWQYKSILWQKEIYINYLCFSLNVLVASLAFFIITLNGSQVSGLLILWVLITINEASSLSELLEGVLFLLTNEKILSSPVFE